MACNDQKQEMAYFAGLIEGAYAIGTRVNREANPVRKRKAGNPRHIFANLMSQRGAKPEVISGAPGHSSVAFTMDTCCHIIGAVQSNASVAQG